MKKELFKFLVLLSVALGAGPAYSSFWQWSKNANTNSTADPSINWAEGMSPSSVNDSARAMMARLAEQRDDQNGLLIAGGSSTAITLTTNQGMCLSPSTTPQDGQSVSFRMNAANGASPTLTVDSCATAPIQSSNGVALTAGTMLGGPPYTVVWSIAASAWLTKDNYVSTYNIPLGGLLHSTISSPPNANFVAAAGQCISQTTYAVYYAAIGSPGVGTCGAGNFNVPIDTRGRVIAGLDNLGGVAASRLTSAANGCGTAFTSLGVTCATGNESRTLTLAQIPTGLTVNGTVTVATSGGAFFPIVTGSNWGGPTTAISGAGFNAPIANNTVVNANTLTGSNTLTSNNTSGTAHSIVQPVTGAYVYVRVI